MSSAKAPTPPALQLIPRTALFGNPVRTQAQVSPDGRFISFLAPRDGVLNVWLAPRGDLDTARPITNDRNRGIQVHFWAYTARHVLFLQDEGGDENWRLYSVDVESGGQRDLTPLEGVQAQVVGLSHRRPDTVLVGLNDREPEWHDLYAIDLGGGERRLIERNDAQFAGYLADIELRPRIAIKLNHEGGGELLRRTPSGWQSFLAYGHADSLTTHPIVIEGEGNTALLVSAVGRDKAALIRIDLQSGEQQVIGASDKADISDVWIEPQTHRPHAYLVEYLDRELTALTPEVERDIERLRKALGPRFDIGSSTLDYRTWIITVSDPVHAVSSHLYERDSGRIALCLITTRSLPARRFSRCRCTRFARAMASPLPRTSPSRGAQGRSRCPWC